MSGEWNYRFFPCNWDLCYMGIIYNPLRPWSCRCWRGGWRPQSQFRGGDGWGRISAWEHWWRMAVPGWGGRGRELGGSGHSKRLSSVGAESFARLGIWERRRSLNGASMRFNRHRRGQHSAWGRRWRCGGMPPRNHHAFATFWRNGHFNYWDYNLIKDDQRKQRKARWQS